MSPNSKVDECVLFKYLWDKANLEWYQNTVGNALSQVNLPLDALLCKDCGCQKFSAQLDLYYINIVQCLHAAAVECVPSVKPGVQKFWWTQTLTS